MNRKGIENNGFLGKFTNDANAQTFATAEGWFEAWVFYYNTTDNSFRFYDGTNWIPMSQLPMLTGIVNPNGVVTGYYGQQYHDSTHSILYKCTSSPSGTVWLVI